MASRRFLGGYDLIYDAYSCYYTAAPYETYYTADLYDDYSCYYTAAPYETYYTADLYDDYSCYYTAAPYETYYTAGPYEVYYQQQPAPARSSARETKTSFSIPVHGPDSEPERERKAAVLAGSRVEPVALVMSAEEAAVRMQAAARGFLARKSVRAVCKVQQELEQVRVKMVSEVDALVTDPRARVAVGEALMRMLLRLDAVRGAREYRRTVIKRVLALHDAIDALETKPASTSAGEEEEDANAPEATAADMAEESAVPHAAEHGSEMENAVHTPIETDVDEAMAGGESEAEAGEEHEKEPGDANVDLDELADPDAEGEWEMVTEENKHAAPVAATSDDQHPLETSSTTSDGVDVRKVMEMVVALCEQSAQQGAVIGALAERVDMLEHTVRRMEEAEGAAGGDLRS